MSIDSEINRMDAATATSDEGNPGRRYDTRSIAVAAIVILVVVLLLVWIL